MSCTAQEATPGQCKSAKPGAITDETGLLLRTKAPIIMPGSVDTVFLLLGGMGKVRGAICIFSCHRCLEPGN